MGTYRAGCGHDRFGVALCTDRNDFSISFQSCGGKEEEEEEEKYDDNNNEFALLRCIERRRDGVVGTPGLLFFSLC